MEDKRARVVPDGPVLLGGHSPHPGEELVSQAQDVVRRLQAEC